MDKTQVRSCMANLMVNHLAPAQSCLDTSCLCKQESKGKNGKKFSSQRLKISSQILFSNRCYFQGI